jgi:hypothetical protein
MKIPKKNNFSFGAALVSGTMACFTSEARARGHGRSNPKAQI